MFAKLSKLSPWVPVVLLILLITCWIELDLYAPSFPQMMHYFATDEQTIQWTLSLNFFGFFMSSLLCGPLADSFGRRPILLGGSLLFALGSLLCVFAPSIESLLLGRFIQGVGVSAPVIICIAVIADIYQGDKQARLLSVMNTTITIVMAIAPIAGVFLTDHFGWRSNFVVICVGALLGTLLSALLLPETHAVNRQPLSMGNVMRGYATLLADKLFMGMILSICLLAAAYFTFIGIIPLLFIEALGVPLNVYAIYQGSVVGMFAVASLTIPAFMNRLDSAKLLRASFWLALISGAVLFVVGALSMDHPVLITVFMCLFTGAIACPSCIMFASAMDLFPGLRASASSLTQALRLLTMAISTSITGALYNETFLPIGVVIFVLAIVAFFMGMTALRIREKKGELLSTSPMVGATH